MTKAFLCLTCKFALTELPEQVSKKAFTTGWGVPAREITDDVYCCWREETKRCLVESRKVYPDVFFCSKLLFVVVGNREIPTQVRSECPEYEKKS